MVTSARLFRKASSPARPRAWLARASLLVLVGMLTACGFTMRGVTPLPFDSLYLMGLSDNTRFGGDVARALRAASPDTQLVTDRKNAQATLIAVSQSRSQRETSLNPQGRVEEYELRVQYTFRLIDARGNLLLPDTTFTDTRDMPYDDNVVQAKQGETETLYRDMEKALVSRLMRRLTAPDVAEAFEIARNSPDDNSLPVAPPLPEPSEEPAQPSVWTNPRLDTNPANRR
ncbi:LPS-assembly lipoprotein LptE [Orrella dioscoreae]|uniref:LPS-assembly lipoprotein LptE n=1 Tax=Orrella dioscoreae TaxID=1851544 RepID=A0A1C3K0A5_9BURK|nr:LPS assembly lipoprotein LptE [Orrella dioscoreae]SBT24838.1 LPS-assembly lipoprotein RlpB precursor (Rare lipoprotein B) [Orrella dioscoreae]SOE50605.1 LPS-assembly lipoprotein RlpB precursor (Rare lipoprotein B) [Orrella dioscoreae]